MLCLGLNKTFCSISSNSETEQCQNAGIAAMTSSAIMTLCNMMLFHGCYKQKRILFLPWLILNMISIVISYLLVLILIGSGIMALVVSQKMDGQMFYNQGEVYDGSKFALVGDLAGMSAIIAGIIALAVTSKLEMSEIRMTEIPTCLKAGF